MKLEIKNCHFFCFFSYQLCHLLPLTHTLTTSFTAQPSTRSLAGERPHSPPGPSVSSGMVQAPCQTPEAGHPATTSQPAIAACPPAQPAPQTVGVDPAAAAALPGPAIGWQASCPRRHTRTGRPRTSARAWPRLAMQGITDRLLLASSFASLGQHSRGAVTQRPLLPQLPACKRASLRSCVSASCVCLHA
jgi:hypothetical protein